MSYDMSCETRFELASDPIDRGTALLEADGAGVSIRACTHIKQIAKHLGQHRRRQSVIVDHNLTLAASMVVQ